MKKNFNFKKCLALLLAFVLIASNLGNYISAEAEAAERVTVDLKNESGYSIAASSAEDTTIQGLNAVKVTPDGTTANDIKFDYWSLKNHNLSASDYKYVAVDYYYDVAEQTGGSWKGWYFGNEYVDDKTESDNLSTTFNAAIEEYDTELVGDSNPKYMVHLKANGWKDIWQSLGLSAGKTYVFSCDYYIPEGSSGSLRFRCGGSEAYYNEEYILNAGRDTAVYEYTIPDDCTWGGPNLVQRNDTGEGYYWNLCVTEKGQNTNLLKNPDFSNGDGSWIGWTFGASEYIESKEASNSAATSYNAEILAYDTAIGGDANPKYMAHLKPNSWKDIMQQYTSVTEGEAYVLSCDYYMPSNSGGSIRFYPCDSTGTRINTIQKNLDGGTSGTAVLEYTIPEGCTRIDPAIVQHSLDNDSEQEGYYWNISLTKKGETTNLLTNADFTIDDAGAANTPENMVIRLCEKVDLSNTWSGYQKSDNAIVKNQWARVIFDVSSFNMSNNYVQTHFFPYGYNTYTDYSKGTTAVGNMYINNVSFYTSNPGQPEITDISFLTNSLKAVRGASVKIPTVTVEGNNYPITAYDLELSGHSSASTYISDGKLYIGADESSETITITAKSVLDDSKTATCTITVSDSINRTEFDDSSIQMRFGVVSDTHLSGSWNQQRSVGKFAHTIEALQKTAQADDATLDAILVNGDFVDAVASKDNVSSDIATYGSKAVQNFREVNYVAQGIWGADEGSVADISDTTTGYGAGISDDTRFFYALGNHDEGGEGKTSYDTASTGYATVYSAEYFAAVFCGWQYDISTSRSDYATAADVDSYRVFIQSLVAYHTIEGATVDKDAFKTSYGVDFDSAYAKFQKYYGFDENYSDENGLLYGNRHMTIGEGDDAIHFVALELSISDTSLDFLEDICKQSVSENANKPIFVITHYKVSEDMPGYEGVQAKVREVMSKYPQIIAWGGHSHTYLHSDAAIDSDEGFIQVDSSTTAYAAQKQLTYLQSQGASSTGKDYPMNANTGENHAFSQGCYVEVDRNFNVRIKRIDLYRSFSADYVEDKTLYSDTIFTDYANQATATAVDAPVFIREAWDITDIGLEGYHLNDYTNARITSTAKPEFTETSKVSVTERGTSITANLTLDASDDGLVYMYVVELWESDGEAALQRYYYTNRFYDYPNIEDIPAVTETVTFNDLTEGTDYVVKAYPVDEFNVAGDVITSDDEKYSPIPSGDPKYMAKLIGTYTDASGEQKTWVEPYQSVYDIKAGTTYEFSYNYYVTDGGGLNGRIMSNDWKILVQSAAEAGKVGTATITYTAQEGDTRLVPLFSKDTTGVAYVWNLCFKEVDGNINLLSNADFSNEDGSWINWTVGGITPTDKAGSDNITTAFGHEIMEFDKTIWQKNYMAKLYGTYNGNSYKQVWQNITVTPKTTYEFSYNYYVPDEGAVLGRLMADDGNGGWTFGDRQVVSSSGKIGTASLTYTAGESDEWLAPLLEMTETGTAYVWNLCFKEVDGDVNLLQNADFTEGDGSWIGWTVASQTPTDKTGSDNITTQFGHAIMEFDTTLLLHVKAEGATLSTTDYRMKVGFDFTTIADELAAREQTVVRYGAVLHSGTKTLDEMKEDAVKIIEAGNTDKYPSYAYTEREESLPSKYTVKISNSNSDDDGTDNRGRRTTAIAYVVTESGDIYYSNKVINHSVMSVLKAIFNNTYLTDEANVVTAEGGTKTPVEGSLFAKALEQEAVTYTDLQTALTAAPTTTEQRTLLFNIHYALNNYAFVLDDSSTLKLSAQSGGADAESATLRTAILNTEDSVTKGSETTYYISDSGSDSNDGTSSEEAVASYSQISGSLTPGDNVLFERGGVYREHIKLVSGVTYAAYGEGEKPAIYGSAQNYVDCWEKTGTDNLWKCTVNVTNDIGTIVFDHGWAAGRRIFTGASDLTKNFDFYQDIDKESSTYGTVYLYLDREPSSAFSDIEFCEIGRIMYGAQNTSDVTIDNLSIKYGGSHGIAFENGSSDISITNCELAWLGGSLQAGDGTSFDDGSSVRYGNGIEFWQNASNITVKNNWIYQIYDAGITHQGTMKTSTILGFIYIEEGYKQTDITFNQNLIEYCSYGIEYFTGNYEKDEWSSITYSNNIIRFAGYGWGQVRPSSWAVSSICGWGGSDRPPFKTSNFTITGNTFDLTGGKVILHYYKDEIEGVTNSNLAADIVTFSENTYYYRQVSESNEFAYWLQEKGLFASNQETLVTAVKEVDTSAVKVEYIE